MDGGYAQNDVKKREVDETLMLLLEENAMWSDQTGALGGGHQAHEEAEE